MEPGQITSGILQLLTDTPQSALQANLLIENFIIIESQLKGRYTLNVLYLTVFLIEHGQQLLNYKLCTLLNVMNFKNVHDIFIQKYANKMLLKINFFEISYFYSNLTFIDPLYLEYNTF